MSNNHSSDWQPPSWWRTEEEQLKRAERIFRSTTPVPRPPKFVPMTASEVPLLHVPASRELLWNANGSIKPPKGFRPAHDHTRQTNSILDSLLGPRRYKFKTSIDLDTDPNLIVREIEYDQPVWLAFDVGDGMGVYQDSQQPDAKEAASEVFSALLQFPDWIFSFESDTPLFIKGYGYYSRSNELDPSYWDFNGGSKIQKHYDNMLYLQRHDSSATLELSYADTWPMSAPTVREY